jgi:hypothetical protein
MKYRMGRKGRRKGDIYVYIYIYIYLKRVRGGRGERATAREMELGE